MDNNMPYQQMVSPYMNNSPVMSYPAEKLEDMYPDIYHRVFPKIQQMCMMKDTPDNNQMYPYPSREIVESMTDDIYRDTMMSMGETEEMDMGEQRQLGAFGGPGYGYPGFGGYPGYFGGYPGYGYPGYGFPGYGRRRPIRDLISILLIRELLRRRGHYYY